MTIDFQKPFIEKNKLSLYLASDNETAILYGEKVRAIEMSNVDYSIRYQKFSSEQKMKPPPRHGRIFAGYLVVRKLSSKDEYETWMPGDAFEDIYEVTSQDKP